MDIIDIGDYLKIILDINLRNRIDKEKESMLDL